MSEQCQETVYDTIASWGGRQCMRKGIVLEGGKWYCKQHSKVGKESRRAKLEGHWTEQERADDERIAQRRERDRRADCFPDLLAALEGLTDGDYAGLMRDPVDKLLWCVYCKASAAHAPIEEHEPDCPFVEARTAIKEAKEGA